MQVLKEVSKKILKVGILDPLEELDPVRSQSYDAWIVLWNVVDTPVLARANGRFESRLVEPFSERVRGSEGVTYKVKVREDRRYSDGTQVTAQDVLRALESCHFSSEQSDIRLDGSTLQITTPQPAGSPEELLCHYTCAVIKHTDDGFIGSGPFTIAPDSTAQRVRLVRNPYFAPPPSLDEVIVQAYPEGMASLAQALEDGEVHFTTALSREHMGRLKNVRKLFAPGNSTGSLYLNTSKPGLDQVQVRQAICSGIDRYALASIAYQNPAAFTARGILPPAMGSHRDGYVYNPEAAKASLEPYLDQLDRPLRLLTVWGARPYLPEPTETADQVVRMLERLGLKVELVPTANNTEYFDILRANDYDMVLGGWIADSPSLAMFLTVLLDPAMVPTNERAPLATANLSRYQSETGYGLLRAYCDNPSDETLHALLDHVAADAPIMPLMYGASVAAHRWEVKGYEPGTFPEFSSLSLSE